MFDKTRAHAAVVEALLTIDVPHDIAAKAADAICKARIDLSDEGFLVELKKELAAAKQAVLPH